MRILSLSNCPLVATQGSGYIITEFSEGLRARGHQVDLFGPETLEPWPFLRGRARSYRQALGMLAFCLRQLKRKHYDVVELWGGEAWLTAWVLSRRAKRPLLVSHSNGLETHYAEVTRNCGNTATQNRAPQKWYQLDQSRLMQRAFTAVNGLVTVSHYDADYARQHRYQNSERIVAIENSLAPEFLDLSVSWERTPIVGYCGSWIERKGINAMRQAMTQLLTQLPHARLLLVGVGEAFNAREQFPKVHSQVDVVPYVSSKAEMRGFYEKMSVLMMPSIYESFGLVAAEAMACGCALVSTRTGFAASLQHGEQAWLLKERAPDELQNVVQELLSNHALRQTIARAGYERVQTLRWQQAVETLESTYLRWIGKSAQV